MLRVHSGSALCGGAGGRQFLMKKENLQTDYIQTSADHLPTNADTQQRPFGPGADILSKAPQSGEPATALASKRGPKIEHTTCNI